MFFLFKSKPKIVFGMGGYSSFPVCIASKILNIPLIYGPKRKGDIPHSHASIKKAQENLNYNPKFNLQKGLKQAVKWYWKNLK